MIFFLMKHKISKIFRQQKKQKAGRNSKTTNHTDRQADRQANIQGNKTQVKHRSN